MVHTSEGLVLPGVLSVSEAWVGLASRVDIVVGVYAPETLAVGNWAVA